MFKEQELNTYRSISAPQELYDKIMAAQKPKRKWRPQYAAGLVAACLVLAMGAGFFFRGGEPGIMINAQTLESTVVFHELAPASEMRNSDVLMVPVELDLPRKSQISVTQGQLILGDAPSREVTAFGTVTVLWEIPRGTSKCELYIDDGKAVTTLTLEKEDSQITITKKGE